MQQKKSQTATGQHFTGERKVPNEEKRQIRQVNRKIWTWSPGVSPEWASSGSWGCTLLLIYRSWELDLEQTMVWCVFKGKV